MNCYITFFIILVILILNYILRKSVQYEAFLISLLKTRNLHLQQVKSSTEKQTVAHSGKTFSQWAQCSFYLHNCSFILLLLFIFLLALSAVLFYYFYKHFQKAYYWKCEDKTLIPKCLEGTNLSIQFHIRKPRIHTEAPSYKAYSTRKQSEVKNWEFLECVYCTDNQLFTISTVSMILFHLFVCLF